jgi:hypothetical protein
VMHPTSEITGNTFSPCSIRTICQKSSVIASCLEDPGARSTITGSQCGNGVKEPGEECDCGPADGVDCKNSQCCEAGQCKLKPTAKCDDKTDGCCQSCQPQPSGTTCRPARSECDIIEKCDGRSGTCPKDSFRPDLEKCKTLDKGDGQCASGYCTTRDMQCKIRGSTSEIDGECPGFSNDCTMTCKQKDGNCVKVSGFYLDGTKCGWDGKCAAGKCKQSFISSVLGWLSNNIAVALVAGALILIVVLMLLRKCCGFCCSALSRKPTQSYVPPVQTDVQTNIAPRSRAPSYSPQVRHQSMPAPQQAAYPGSFASPHQSVYSDQTGYASPDSRKPMLTPRSF